MEEMNTMPSFKSAVTKITGLQCGNQEGQWVIKDGAQWRELSEAESVACEGEYSIMITSAQNDKALEEAHKTLSSTDWYYARKMETGQEVPADVVEKRLAARALINAIEAE